MAALRFALPLAVFSMITAAGCGGSSAPEATRAPAAQITARPAAAKKAQPVSFEVSANRVGSAVVLTIVGVGRAQLEGEPFEDPSTWDIECRVGGRSLQRVVNGSARVERAPVGPIEANRWDVTVRYTVGFAVPPHIAAVEVGIEAPGAEPFTSEIRLEVASL